MKLRSSAESSTVKMSSIWLKISQMIILIIGITGLIFLWRWWRVSQVICLADGQILVEVDCPASHLIIGQFILSLDLDDPKWIGVRVITDAEGRNWSLSQWSKKLPSQVKLSYELSPFQYLLVQENQVMAVTSTGKVSLDGISSQSATLLPTVLVGAGWAELIVINGQVEAGFDAWIKQLLEVYSMAGESFQINLIDQFTAQLNWSDWKIIITPMVDPRLEFQKLKIIKSTLGENDQELGKDYSSVDLRFKLPVLIPVDQTSQPTVSKPTPASNSAKQP